MKIIKNVLILASLSLALTACGENKENVGNESSNNVESTVSNESSKNLSKDYKESSDIVLVKDIHGEVEVKKNPSKVISLDNRSFETLEDFGVSLQAAPKDVMPADMSYVLDESVENIGNHREPNLEKLVALDPELVIVGQRFAKYYDDIKEILPNTTIIDYSYDVSGESENPGQTLVNGFKESTMDLGKIFSKEDEAQKLVNKLDKSIENVKNSYKGDSVLGIVASGGNLGFSAPRYGRVWGPIYDIFDLKPALEVKDSSSDHKGDDVSVEAIADANPDYLLVLDRDAGVSDTESESAKDLIENSKTLSSTDAVKNKNIVYAPNDTYTNESIQTYTEIFEKIEESFK